MTPFWALLTGILIGVVVSGIASLALILGTAYVCEVDRIYCEEYKNKLKEQNNELPVSDAEESV